MASHYESKGSSKKNTIPITNSKFAPKSGPLNQGGKACFSLWDLFFRGELLVLESVPQNANAKTVREA